jgi:hypothetical protein
MKLTALDWELETQQETSSRGATGNDEYIQEAPGALRSNITRHIVANIGMSITDRRYAASDTASHLNESMLSGVAQ